MGTSEGSDPERGSQHRARNGAGEYSDYNELPTIVELPPIEVYGHTYHGSDRILVPNDASERRRTDTTHELFKLCLDGKLFAARLPLDQRPSPSPECGMDAPEAPQERFQILDVGSGTGAWACEMANKYPEVDILGIDLTGALLPKRYPSNLVFEIRDASDPWPPRLFDFIYMRDLVGGGIRDWDALIARAFAHLKPGGFLEFTEIRPKFYTVDEVEGSHQPEGGEVPSAAATFEREFIKCSLQLGIEWGPADRIPGMLAKLGAGLVAERKDWVPAKPWGRDSIMLKKGRLMHRIFEEHSENWTMRMFGKCGWSEAAIRDLLARLRAENKGLTGRHYTQMIFITARKPGGTPRYTQSPRSDIRGLRGYQLYESETNPNSPLYGRTTPTALSRMIR